MRKSKKYLALLMSACILAGCGSEANPETTNTPAPTEAVSETPAPTEAPAATEAPAVTEAPAAEYNIPDITTKTFDIPQSEAQSFVTKMAIGWNLGNTFDAIQDPTPSDEMKLESLWCGAKTQQKMMTQVHNAGFNTVRIPVSWHNHVSGDNYQISEQWMARVKEVVGWALDEGMYVILNVHHDNSTDFYYPTPEYKEQSEKYLNCVWTQIAEEFKDYDEHLIFETLNEPRMVGTNYEWWINASDKSCQDAVELINGYNQVALDAIRATGGNNATRYLMIPGYDASPSGALNSGFRLPTDTVDNKLILSVHAYSPYDFALNTSGTDKFSSTNASDVAGITADMDKLFNTYVSKGIPVVIGEFGSMAKNKNTEARVDHAACFIANAAARGLTCVWWDNNNLAGSGEPFGLMNRKHLSLEWKYPEIVAALMKYVVR